MDQKMFSVVAGVIFADSQSAMHAETRRAAPLGPFRSGFT